MLTRFPLAAGLLLLLLPVLYEARAQQKTASSNEAPRIEVVESSEDQHETLQEKPALTFGATRTPNLTITVNDAVRYQQIDGFGASLTDSSAWLLWSKLTEAQRKEALQMLFSPTKGIGLSILRQPMGASDFALTEYSYDDLPPGQPFGASDPDLKRFSIEHDRAYILPLLRESQSQSLRLALELSGLDENFRIHDSRRAAAFCVSGVRQIFRPVRAAVRSSGRPHFRHYHAERAEVHPE